MQTRLDAVLKRLFPNYQELGKLEKLSLRSNFVGLLLTLPYTVTGFFWLLSLTRPETLRTHGGLLLLLLAVGAGLSRLSFGLSLELPGLRGSLINVTGSFDDMVLFSGMFIVGPVALWLIVLINAIFFAVDVWQRRDALSRIWLLENIRPRLDSIAMSAFAGLVSVMAYQALGGTFPLPGLTLDSVLPALAAVLVNLLLTLIIMAPIIIAFIVPTTVRGEQSIWRMLLPFLLSIVVAGLFTTPFAILGAGLFSVGGWVGYSFFLVGTALVALLANRLTQSVQRSLRRERELTQLELLSRALLDAPPDASTLPALLREFLPGMFVNAVIEVYLYATGASDALTIRYPDSSATRWQSPAGLWAWLKTSAQTDEPLIVPQGERLPFEDRKLTYPLIVVPVLRQATAQDFPQQAPAIEPAVPNALLGGVCLGVPQLNAPQTVVPAVQSLAAQIASALHRAEVYRQTLIHQRNQQELELAAQIQRSFLPQNLDQIFGPGFPQQSIGSQWGLTVMLESARQASGDFYDAFLLSNGCLGVVVADVADKGMGAAMYMALSRTLIRTYALEYPDAPGHALATANNRILGDADIDLFVTVFYGVLDLHTGGLRYANAGHNPPLLVTQNSTDTPDIRHLTRTGIPLGMFEDQAWRVDTAQMRPGSSLIIFSDGVTEAQNTAGDLFGDARLEQVSRQHVLSPAPETLQAVLRAVDDFVAGAPQADDITLAVITRAQAATQ